MKNKAFSLIELLVTVGIIGILGAIAIPNFLEAQTRSKVSREKANLHTIATALESYRTDNEVYPYAALPELKIANPSKIDRLKQLTTPISYISQIPTDIFSPIKPPENVTNYLDKNSYFLSERYKNDRPSIAGVDIKYFTQDNLEWLIMSFGPSKERPNMNDGFNDNDLYDPTNGTISIGLIVKKQ